MAEGWRRPAEVPLPTVWRRCRGLRPMADGRVPDFWIQDATPDLDDAIIDFMSDSFLKEELFCSITRVLEDPTSLEEIRAIWRRMLQQRAALVALSHWPGGPDAPPRIAGANVTCVSLPSDPHLQAQGAALRKVLGALHAVEERVDVFAAFGVDAFLNALGLSVAPAFRGQGLGLELLLARDALARACGLRLTVTVFTGHASQKQSERAGFRVLAEQRYDQYRDAHGDLVFPDAPCDVFQLKAKRID